MDWEDALNDYETRRTLAFRLSGECPECLHPGKRHTLDGCQECGCARPRGTKGKDEDLCPRCLWMNKHSCGASGCPDWIVEAVLGGRSPKIEGMVRCCRECDIEDEITGLSYDLGETDWERIAELVERQFGSMNERERMLARAAFFMAGGAYWNGKRKWDWGKQQLITLLERLP